MVNPEKEEQYSVRLDKWLWSVRIYKTRSQAASACRTGAVKIGGTRVKPSRIVRLGERIETRKKGILKNVEVLGLLDKRVGAKLVEKYYRDITPPEERKGLSAVEWVEQSSPLRNSERGRPTKRQRRAMERLWGD